METKNSTSVSIRKSILICILLMTAVTPVFSQTNSLLLIPVDAFDLEVIFTVLGVVALALFMFVAFIKHRNKVNKEISDTRHDRSRSQISHTAHRRQSNMGHFKY